MKRCMYTTLFVLSLSVVLSPALAADDDPAITLDVRSIEAFLKDVDAFTKALNLPPQRDTLASVLKGAPHFQGVDWKQPAQLYLFLRSAETSRPRQAIMTAPPSLVAVMPLEANSRGYLKALQSKLPTSRITDQVLRRAGGGTGPGSNLRYFTVVKEHVVAAEQRQYFDVVVKRLQAGAALGTLHEISGSIRAGINVQQCLPLLKESMQAVTATMPTEGNPAMPGMGNNPAEMMKAQMELGLKVLTMFKSFTLGAGMKDGVPEITSGLTPTTDSAIGKIFSNGVTLSDRYLRVLPPDATMTSVGTGMNAFDDFIDPYVKLMEKMGEAAGGAAAVAMIKEFKGVYAGEYAVGLVKDGKSCALVEVFAVTDGPKVRDVVTKAMNGYTELMGAAQGVAIKPKGKRVHKGVTIYSYLYSVDIAAASGQPQMAAALPDWFEKIPFELAVTDKDMIYVVGARTVMDATLDRLADPAAPRLDRAQAFLKLYPQTKGKPIGVMTLSLMQTLKGLLGCLPPVTKDMLAQIPEIETGIVGYAYQKDNAILGSTKISPDEILSVQKGGRAAFGVLMQAMFMAQMQKGGAAVPQPDAQAARCRTNLRRIHAAKEQCALERNLGNGVDVHPAWLKDYLPRGQMPNCPDGGAYSINPIGKNPQCTKDNHALQ